MLKTVITIQLIFFLQIIVSAGTEAYIEKQKKLYETSLQNAEKEWEDAKKAKKEEEIFALKKYINAIEGVKAYWTKKEDFDKALVYKKQADEFRSLLDEMKSNSGIPDEKPTTVTQENVAVHRPKEIIPTIKKNSPGKVIDLKDVRVTMSSSKEAPAINEEDIANFGNVIYQDKWWHGEQDAGSWAKGQTFNTKNDVYLKSFTYQIFSKKGVCPPTKSYTIRVCKVAGDKATVICKGTCEQDFAWNSEEYMTWSFDKGIPLDASTTYSIDIKMTDSTTLWGMGLPLINCTDNEYSDGESYNLCPNTGNLKTHKNYNDRIFHLDLHRR